MDDLMSPPRPDKTYEIENNQRLMSETTEYEWKIEETCDYPQPIK
jgi:hypothetical protein